MSNSGVDEMTSKTRKLELLEALFSELLEKAEEGQLDSCALNTVKKKMRTSHIQLRNLDCDSFFFLLCNEPGFSGVMMGT